MLKSKIINAFTSPYSLITLISYSPKDPRSLCAVGKRSEYTIRYLNMENQENSAFNMRHAYCVVDVLDVRVTIKSGLLL